MPNANTRPPVALVSPDIRRMEEGLDLALAALHASSQPRPSVPGVHVFAVFGGNVTLRFLPAASRGHLVIGRHESCDIKLSADPTISLRHLLAQATVLADGSTALRLLDLHTAMPFVLANNATPRSIVATGPIAVAIGPYVVGSIPQDHHEYQPQDVIRETRPHGGVTQVGPYRSAPLIEASERIPDSALVMPSGLRRSRITLLPRSEMISQMVPAPQDPGAGRLTLSRTSGDASSAVIPEVALERGVLIGRAERCFDGGRQLMTPCISRVHLMLLRDAQKIYAIDLASTQGTYENGRRVRQTDLTGRTAALTLGQYDRLQLVWQSLG